MFLMKMHFYRFLYEIEKENLEMFSLCNSFNNLSLEDNTGSSSSSSSSSSSTRFQPSSAYSYGGVFHRFLRRWTHSLSSQSINTQLRAPFVELPRNMIENPSGQSFDNIMMFLGFRFLPGQPHFLSQELTLPESYERLSLILDSLGVSY